MTVSFIHKREGGAFRGYGLNFFRHTIDGKPCNGGTGGARAVAAELSDHLLEISCRQERLLYDISIALWALNHNEAHTHLLLILPQNVGISKGGNFQVSRAKRYL